MSRASDASAALPIPAPRAADRAIGPLAEVESRFSSLVALSSDFYWETDAAHRLTVRSKGGATASLAALGGEPAVLGRTRWELPSLTPGEDGWQAHRADLDARRPFRDFQFSRPAADGAIYHFSISGEPRFDAGGRFCGYRGVGTDITSRKREENLLATEHAATRVLAQAQGRDAGMASLIRIVCELQGWDYGRYWKLDEAAGVMRFSDAWSVPDPAIRRHLEQTRGITFRPGEGLVGQVLESGKPVLVADLGADPKVLQEMLVHQTGLRGACTFPVTFEGKTIGVLAFVGRTVREADARLLAAMAAIGSQVGQFLVRAESQARLRENEGRFRSLIELSSDWYWEQDAELRFVNFSGGNIPGKWGRDQLNAVGKRRWEIPGVVAVNTTWDEHRALCEAHQPFRDLQYRRVHDDGTPHYVSASGHPVYDDVGRFIGYRGVATDITARKREERLLALEHAVTRHLYAAESAGAGLRAVMREICEAEGWQVARYWRVDDGDEQLRLGESWCEPGQEQAEERSGSRDVVFARGAGLAGRVWDSGEPLWVADVSRDDRVKRANLGRDNGMRGAFLVPVKSDGRILGVLAFASRSIREPDERLLQAMRVIWVQVGQFLQRKQAEAVLREGEARYRSLVGLAADWYWELDENLRLRYVSKESGPVRAPEADRAIGKLPWELNYSDLDHPKWQSIRATFAERKPFRDFEAVTRDEFGTLRTLMVSGHPVFDAAGRFKGYRGISQDVTPRRRAELLHALEHSVARCLADNEDPATAVGEVLRTICETRAVECARFFQIDEAEGVLRHVADWGLDDPSIQEYLEASRGSCLRRDEGICGLVWQTGKPIWVADIASDPRCWNAARLTAAGLRTAFVVPVATDGRTMGVLAFLGKRMREPDDRVLRTAHSIGGQLGQYLLRKRSEEALVRFRAALDAAGDAVVLIDRRSLRYIDVNQTFCNLVGYAREEIIGMTPTDVFNADREALERDYDAIIADSSNPASKVTGEYRCKDGTVVAVETHRRALPTKDGWIIVASARDIRDRIAQEQALRDSNQRLQLQAWRQERIARFGQFALRRRGSDELVAEAIQELGSQADVVAMFERTAEGDLALRLAHGADVAESIGKSAPLAAGSAAHRVLAGGVSVPVSADYLAAAPDCWPWSRWMKKMRSGAFVPVTHNGHAHGMLGIFSSGAGAIDEEEVHFAESIGNVLSTALQREKAEQRLAFLAQFDSLTGLPNRSLLEDRLKQTMAQSRRQDRNAAVLFVDLDRFKLVNDTLGHQAGDLMIREVGRRLELCVRAGDTVGRISGDEFAVVLADLAHGDDAGAVAQKILDALAAPFDLEGSEAFVTASIGISIYPADGDDADTLIRNADMAMYKAKKSARNTCRFFTAKMNDRTVAKLQLGTELRRAIDRREFELHYQPKFDLVTRAITGLEALLRWNHPQRGLVSPAEFIPALEDSGLILPVGEWVIEEACAQIRRWQLAGLSPVPVAINLSAKQFRRQDLDGAIQRALQSADLPSSMLELEITESSLADDPEEAVRILTNLREAGMKISVDDFGTGYSSLSYLTRLPISALKIDRSFVRDAAERPEAAAIVRAIIDMAHNMKFTVVAEGVETDWQAQFLRLYKCDQAQGYLFSKPVPAAEAAKLLGRPGGMKAT